MPAMEPTTADLYETVVTAALAARPGGSAGLPLAVHRAYREAAENSYRQSLLRRVNEELTNNTPPFTVAQLSLDLGYNAATLGRWLNGTRTFDVEFVFAMELWLQGVSAYAPFAEGVLEAARAEGMCAAVAVTKQALHGLVAALAPADFWQLHHLFAFGGWQGTPGGNARRFEATALAASARANREYADVCRALERVAPPPPRPRTLADLEALDAEWGLPYLLARTCLSTEADDPLAAGGAAVGPTPGDDTEDVE